MQALGAVSCWHADLYQYRHISARGPPPPFALPPPLPRAARRLLAVGLGLREDRRAVEAMSRTGQQQELLRGPLYYTIVLLAVTGFYWRESAVGGCSLPSSPALRLM